MCIKKYYSLSIVALMVLNTNCSPQNKQPEEKLINRQPYAAGRFYSGDSAELRSDLKKIFAAAAPKEVDNVIAIISPHAGYVYSGEVAASAYDQIDRKKKYDNIFILGSSHVKYYDGASVYSKGDYVTPLGIVKVNRDLAKKLSGSSNLFTFDREADAYEHSLEVQLPFLQYIMEQDFQIVPIILGTQSPQTCQTIAEALKPYFNAKNLFIISTDFSHYPSYKDAVRNDSATARAVESGSPDVLISTINSNAEKGIPQLATSMCGWTSVLTLLYMSQNNPGITISPIKYMNSGDVPYGDKSRVVGYYALAFSLKGTASSTSAEFQLTKEDKKGLLDIARSSITDYVKNREIPALNVSAYSEHLKAHCGAFVTLNKDGKLRGCIGRFSAEEPLYSVVQQMAIASATEDSRFTPVTVEEIPELEIEISVLTPMKKISSIDEIVLGKHGIYIKKGWASGTFLPQVATETGWTKEEFLGHCSRDKAGLGWDGWKNAEIYIYEANVFSEKDLK